MLIRTIFDFITKNYQNEGDTGIFLMIHNILLKGLDVCYIMVVHDIYNEGEYI